MTYLLVGYLAVSIAHIVSFHISIAFTCRGSCITISRICELGHCHKYCHRISDKNVWHTCTYIHIHIHVHVCPINSAANNNVQTNKANYSILMTTTAI